MHTPDASIPNDAQADATVRTNSGSSAGAESGLDGSRLVCDAPMWATLHAHLLQDDVEQAAVMYARATRREHDVLLDALHLELLGPGDFAVQCDVHIELTEAAQQRLIKTAWDLGTALVEFHSHVDPRYPAVFSASDLAGFAEFVPHVWWRLQGAPYAAVVVAPGSFDALVWRDDPRRPEPLAGIELRAAPHSVSGPPVDGLARTVGSPLRPTGDTYRHLTGRHRAPSAAGRTTPAGTRTGGNTAELPSRGDR